MFRKFVTILAALAVIMWIGLIMSTPMPQDAPFVIAQGESVDSIVDRLESEGYIRSTLFFRLALRGSGLAKQLQPGSYDLSQVGTYEDLIAVLATGKLSRDEVEIRILEGWDLSDISAHLEEIGVADSESFYAVVGQPALDYRVVPGAAGQDLSESYPFLWDKPHYVSLEGYLFPDTYRVFADASAENVVNMLLRNFEKRMDDDLKARIVASDRSMFEIVTMASIIEREVRGDEDRRKVSDLFWRRLDQGMPLQADSTVNYVTGKDLPAVTYEDTDVDSRYNTYKYRGLPLGPIGNPGISALRAAVDPEPNPYVYFLTDKEGNVHYGRTLEEHNANKARYLR